VIEMPVVSTGNPAVLAPAGQLEDVSVLRFRQELERTIDAGHTQVVVDLGGVSSLSEEAVAALVSAWQRLQTCQGQLRVVAPAGPIVGQLRTAAPIRSWPVYPDVAAALAEPGHAV